MINFSAKKNKNKMLIACTIKNKVVYLQKKLIRNKTMKKLTIEITEDETGKLESKASLDGFNYLELLGLQFYVNNAYEELLNAE